MLKVVPNNRDYDTRNIMSQTKFYEAYSRWDDDKERYETWDESVTRVMDMHRNYYKEKMTPALNQLINEAESYYKLQYVLGAQRALQFGGDQIMKHMMRMYNCTSSYADRPRFFSECFYVLLCGAGAGFSVQKHHVDKMPNIADRKKQAKGWVIEDSIEGWADALGVLLSTFFEGGGQFPDFEGRRVYFDLTQIRPKGSMISGGFKAPGVQNHFVRHSTRLSISYSLVFWLAQIVCVLLTYTILLCMLLMQYLLVVFVVLRQSVYSQRMMRK